MIRTRVWMERACIQVLALVLVFVAGASVRDFWPHHTPSAFPRCPERHGVSWEPETSRTVVDAHALGRLIFDTLTAMRETDGEVKLDERFESMLVLQKDPWLGKWEESLTIPIREKTEFIRVLEGLVSAHRPAFPVSMHLGGTWTCGELALTVADGMTVSFWLNQYSFSICSDSVSDEHAFYSRALSEALYEVARKSRRLPESWHWIFTEGHYLLVDSELVDSK